MLRSATVVLLAASALAACHGDDVPAPRRVVDGSADRGRAVLTQFGCPACHTIPGVPDADGIVGPSLTRFGKRAYIAGVYPNEPGNLVRWIMNAPAMAPLTAMPDMNVSKSQAQDIAAYLYTLR